MAIHDLDLRILNAMQDDLPLVPDPWEEIGTSIGISGAEILTRVNRLADSGIIRGIVPTLESGKRAHMASTLIALSVPEERITECAVIINEYPEVSHNFRREHEYNLWFTVAAVSTDRIEEIVQDILKRTNIQPDAMLNLTTIQKYKINVTFPLVYSPDGGLNGRC
jgi:DNA-binding Lrp family transcriptional regulator